jgi:hypothetical protein
MECTMSVFSLCAAVAIAAGFTCGGCTATPAAGAGAGGEDGFTYPVARTASVQHDIPGTATTFSAAAGEPLYLWARNLSVRSETTLGPGDNIGNTFAIACRDGSGDPVPGERGAYWAANLVPPQETTVVPTLRWLFVAPDNGRFTCGLTVSSYSTIVDGGREVIMKIPRGAELSRAAYPRATRWTLQAPDAATVSDGATLTTLGATFAPAIGGANRIAVTQDAALTTCKAGSTIPGCTGGSTAHPGTTVRTWVEGRPQTSTGATCGTPLRSPPVTRSISTAKHHLTATNTLYLTEAQLAGCTRIRVTLKIQHVAGNPVRVHGGLTGGLAATHGVAFEYH